MAGAAKDGSQAVQNLVAANAQAGQSAGQSGQRAAA
jgi:hypothetical protein